MKILGISGGTLNGANDCMCKEALLGAKEAGAEVEFIRLLDLDIQHCTGCKACVMGLFSGRGNMCVIKDDFQWLLDKMLDADGILFSIPIFEKCAMGLFHTIMDRFGPRMGRTNNMAADHIAQEKGGKRIDPRYMQDKCISYMAIGGSDWATQVQCDFSLHALTPMWKMIDCEAFRWSLGILADDEKVARAHQIGVNLATQAKNIETATWQGEDGVCPHCHSRNFYIELSNQAVCGTCGMRGVLTYEDGVYKFDFPKEQLKHAHDTISGQFIHSDDIQANEAEAGAKARSDEYKQKVQRYKDFISATKPA
ncbi:MAG: flavodoxin family protein [Eubacterium sp.]|nr:flavodoxin family protein [Eubacterium sp.]